MKNYKFLLLIFFVAVSFSTVNAQTVKIDTSKISYENKLRPCIGVQVDPGKELLTKAWGNYLNKNYSIKLKGFGLFSTSDILKAEDIMIATVSDRRMNLFTETTTLASGSVIKVFASYGYDIFIGEDNFPKEYNALKGILNNFLLKFLNDYYSDRIKSTSNDIKKLNNEKVKLLRAIEKNNKKIFKLTNDIAVTNATINSNNEESIKAVEKTAKMNNEKTSLENENSSASVKAQLIEEKLNQLNEKLDILKSKQSNLL